MALTYNTNIFTQVNKWDRNNQPYGVLVSGKLNQYNRQGYPILDAIDIDWDGAYVKSLNCYLYTTEDLINCLNLSYNNLYNNFGNFTSYSYFSYSINKEKDNLINIINEGDSYNYSYTTKEISYILGKIEEQYIMIENLRNLNIDSSIYYKLKYDDIVKNNKLKFNNRKYYIYDNNTKDYKLVTDNFIINNPDEIYYINVITNIVQDMQEIQDINDFIGYDEYNEQSGIHSYTGLLEKLHNYDLELEDIQEELSYTTNLATNAYSFAYISYAYIDGIRRQVLINTNNIGFHTSYNIYKPISQLTKEELTDYLSNNGNKIYYDDNGTYKITTYNRNYDGQYYAHYDVILGTGIEREIELLDKKIYDNSYILYKLNTKSNSPEYISLYIGPNSPGSQERTIETELTISNINPSTGQTTKGLITNSGLQNSFAYVFDWEILNKE